MEYGTYVDGRPLNYDEASGQFDIGGTPVSTQDVLAYDAAGQLTWASEELRAWAHSAVAPTPPAPPAMATEGAEKHKGLKAIPTWGKVLLVLAIVALLGCCGVGVLGGIFFAADKTDSGSVVPVETTETATEPAPEAAAPSVSSEEVAYAQEVTAITNDVAKALGEIGGSLTENAAAVFTDDDVQDELAAQMAIVSSGYDRIDALDPPARFESSHADLLEAMRLFDESMKELAAGIDDIDAKRVTKASELMMQGSEKMSSAAQKLTNPSE